MWATVQQTACCGASLGRVASPAKLQCKHADYRHAETRELVYTVQTKVRLKVRISTLGTWKMDFPNIGTLDSGINIVVRFSIFGLFSRGYIFKLKQTCLSFLIFVMLFCSVLWFVLYLFYCDLFCELLLCAVLYYVAIFLCCVVLWFVLWCVFCTVPLFDVLCFLCHDVLWCF